jgi:hypothetical protein
MGVQVRISKNLLSVEGVRMELRPPKLAPESDPSDAANSC